MLPSRRTTLVIVTAFAVILALGATVYSSVTAPDPCQTLLRACRREAASSMVTVSTTIRMVAMAAPESPFTT